MSNLVNLSVSSAVHLQAREQQLSPFSRGRRRRRSEKWLHVLERGLGTILEKILQLVGAQRSAQTFRRLLELVSGAARSRPPVLVTKEVRELVGGLIEIPTSGRLANKWKKPTFAGPIRHRRRRTCFSAPISLDRPIFSPLCEWASTRALGWRNLIDFKCKCCCSHTEPAEFGRKAGQPQWCRTAAAEQEEEEEEEEEVKEATTSGSDAKIKSSWLVQS